MPVIPACYLLYSLYSSCPKLLSSCLPSYHQAQAAVLTALPQLHHLKVPTRRPDDYFAEMAKTDQQMQKV